MKKQTKPTKHTKLSKLSTKAFLVGSHEGQLFASVTYTSQDFKNSLLIVSVAINLFILTLWLTTQVSQDYALSLAQYIAR
jgi:hypothetical protein